MCQTVTERAKLILSVWNDLEGGCEEFDGLRDFWLGQFLGAGRVRLWEVYSWIGARDTLISSFRFLSSSRGCVEHFVQRGPFAVT